MALSIEANFTILYINIPPGARIAEPSTDDDDHGENEDCEDW